MAINVRYIDFTCRRAYRTYLVPSYIKSQTVPIVVEFFVISKYVNSATKSQLISIRIVFIKWLFFFSFHDTGTTTNYYESVSSRRPKAIQ